MLRSLRGKRVLKILVLRSLRGKKRTQNTGVTISKRKKSTQNTGFTISKANAEHSKYQCYSLYEERRVINILMLIVTNVNTEC